ncbi:MAG: peptidoglycan DD-metalloendopeptidase family protein [Sarcina sp.]
MEKFKNLLKRESFYVVLFICLLVVTAVAIYAGGKKANNETQKPVVQNTVGEETKAETNGQLIPDAELVNKEDKKENKEEAKDNKTEETAKKDDSVATNAKPTKEFINPVEKGVVTRTFNIAPRIENDGQSANVYKGIDIEVAAGTEVKSATEGVVLEAKNGDSKVGNYVLVQCTSGMKILYGNLDKEIKVKSGDKVTQGALLGKVGTSIKMNPKDRVSKEYLLLHVEKNKEPLDPTKYFKEIPIKK